MRNSTRQFIVQQLSLTLGTAYAVYAPGESTLQQGIAADYWATHFVEASYQPLFVSTWIVGYHFQWAVQQAVFAYTQTRNRIEFSGAVARALQQVENQLGGIVNGPSTIFDAQHKVLQSSDEQQDRRIEGLMVEYGRSFANDSLGVWTAFLKDGTWRRLMTWVIRGLDEALAHVATDHTEQITTAQLSVRSGISELLCTWYLDARMSPEEQTQAVKSAIAELTTRWGYRDVTELILQMNAADAAAYPEEHQEEQSYLCVLQTPEGGPVYCCSFRRLFNELQAARARNMPYERCPAPDPR